jgi:hypothetical protein
MFLIAMSLGVAAAFLTDTRFFIAGAVVALTTMFMRFKDNGPVLPPKPHVATDPVDVLGEELRLLDTQMDQYDKDCFGGPEDGSVITFNKLTESRDKISLALVELAKGKK